MKRTELKRGKGLERRTPLKASNLQRGGSTLPRRARLAPRSPKAEAAYVVRRRLVRDLLNAYPVCQLQWACRGARAVDVHERVKRSRGGNILDPEQAHMVTTCRACHILTEEKTAEATRRRALLPSWHKCPEIGPC